MTVLAKCLIESAQAAAAQTTMYTAPAGTRTIIDKLTGTNTTGSSAQITVNLVPSGSTASAPNVITPIQTIVAGGSYTFPEVVGHILNPGDFISVLAGSVAITVRASGREVT